MHFNLNSYNGLPTDEVYCMMRDRLGYLWIGTERGVLKYNGYNLKLFDATNGLQDPDVWDFFEDSKGRIWLSRISSEFGYIQYDKYHRVHPAYNMPFIVYPKYIRETKDGVIFLSAYKSTQYLCTVSNDTLYLQPLQKSMNSTDWHISGEGQIFHYDTGSLFRIEIDEGTLKATQHLRANKLQRGAMMKNYFVMSPSGETDSLVLINMADGRRFARAIPEQRLYNAYVNHGRSYLVGHKYVYIFDSSLNSFEEKPLDAYLNSSCLKNNTVAYVIEDSLWGNCIATTRGGLYMSFDIQHFIKKPVPDLSKHQYCGTDRDGRHYWWNTEYQALAILKPDNTLQHIRPGKTGNIGRLTDNGGGHLLMVAWNFTGMLDKNNFNLLHLSPKQSYYIRDNRVDPLYSYRTIVQPDSYVHVEGTQFGIWDKDGVLHLAGKASGYYTFRNQNDTVIETIHHFDRYKGIQYVPAMDRCIIYADNTVTVGKGNSLTHFTESMLRVAGINRVEKIIVDSIYGNIFIQDIKKLFLFNIHSGKFAQVFSRLHLDQSQIAIDNDMLIIGGKHGVTFSKITGRGRLSAPVQYANTKSVAYKNLYDIVPSGDEVLLNTDNGLLAVAKPVDWPRGNRKVTSPVRYQLVVTRDASPRAVSAHDTIILSKSDARLQFDFINPTGVGKLRFLAGIAGVDTALIELNNGELQLSDVAPDKYYKLTLRVADDLWQSPDIKLVLFRAPTFWQTTSGKMLLWALGIAGAATIIFLTIYYTRRIVSAKHMQKNYLLSLELKAIYAQINPHFIFNTLNTGLYFISENKNEEAYKHISSFSDLLRSYIKSSRNKYTPLSDEMENLAHYIQLQQTRFENKFSYSMEVDEEIKPETTLIPSLLLQPYIENAINHGLLHRESKGHLSIKFISGNPEKEIICIIDDNGVGRSVSAQINSDNPNKPRSYGNELIEDLVKLINTDGHLRVNIEYRDKAAPETGTAVIITIKKAHHDK